MAAETRHESTHPKESSTFSLLSGWAQQGAQTLFATQRILIDLAMRQNASVMHAVRQQLSDPHHSPTAILGEIAEDGLANFFEWSNARPPRYRSRFVCVASRPNNTRHFQAQLKLRRRGRAASR